LAVYTDITEAELDPLLSRFGLGAALTFKGIAEGVENSNFFLETEAGRFILTLYERRVREDDLPFFLALMHWLAARGFPCPTPQADRDGQMLQRIRDKPAALVSFLNGVSVSRPSPRHCREAGEGLARLHLAGAGFEGRRENTLGAPSWAHLFEGQEASADTLQPGLAQVIATDLESLAASWPTGLPSGVIHADFFPDNVFFFRGRFAAAIDFYFACNDALAYDVAVCLVSWCFDPDGRFKPDHARGLLAGYEAVRPLQPAERGHMAVLAMGAAMRFFLTRLIDWTSTPAGALVKPKDPMEYASKLAFFRDPEARTALAALFSETGPHDA
jgi:homoserine kinase type II